MNKRIHKTIAGLAAAWITAAALPAFAAVDPLALRADSPLTSVREEGIRYILGPAADGEWTYGDFYLQFENQADSPLTSDVLLEDGHADTEALRTGDDVADAVTGETAVAVVKGDLLGTGRWNISQLVCLAGALSGSRQLTRIQELAADLSGDGRILINDLVQMAQHRFTEIRKDGSTAEVPRPGENPGGSAAGDRPSQDAAAQRLLAIADRYVGTPYELYTAGPDTFDCSGFVWHVLNEAGISCRLMSSTAYSEFAGWEPIQDAGALRPGDLVFFKSDSGTKVSHVGFYAGDGNIIHAAPSIGGVGYSTMAAGYYQRNFVIGRRPF